MRIQPQAAPRTAPRPLRADARSERIEHWLRDVYQGTLSGVRGASSAYAGQMVGMAVGAAVAAPLAVATGNVFVFFGGSALLGCAGAYAAYRWDRKHPGTSRSGLLDGALLAGAGAQAVPRFVYPSLMGASAADRSVILGSLDQLPMGSVTSLSSVRVLPGLDHAQVSGMALPGFSQNSIYLDRESLHSWNFGHELVSHEVGHCRDFENVRAGVFGAHSLHRPFGHAPFVTWYARTDMFEDFAETHAQYHAGNRAALEAATPAKFHALEQLQRPGLGEQWASRPEVREAGRQVGAALEAVPYLRQGLELAAGLVAPVQMRRGAARLEAGFLSGDASQKFQGKMALASGLMMLGGAGPLGAVLTGATSAVVGGLVADGKLSLDQANRLGNGAVAVAAGPLGMMGSGIAAELVKGGVDLSQVVDAPGQRGPSRGPRELPWVLAGISGGLFAGATVGALTGGVGGAITGMVWGPLAGGALGLGLGLATRPPSTPGRLDLTPSDRVYLGRVIGCGAAGGVLGSVLGGRFGSLAGAAVGGAALGPAGAVTGAFVGRFAGMMLGALALGRAGAFAGRKWDEG